MRSILSILVPIIFAFYSNPGLAQKSSGCKFEIDNIDSKTGKPNKKIKTKLTGTDTYYIIISRNDTSYKLILNFWIPIATNAAITRNEVMTIKLSGGHNLKLLTSSTVKPVPHYSDQTWAEYSPEYPIRSADLEKFKSISPMNISLKVDDEMIIRELNEKDCEKLKDIVRCIMR